MKNIWFILPVYNEEDVIKLTSEKLLQIINNLIENNKISNDSKILFVDDGSDDNSWKIIEELHNQNDKIKGLKLSTNSGQQNAIFAGLMHVKNMCDGVITLDSDLQDDISYIKQFVEKFDEGYELVLASHVDRQSDSFLKKFTANYFYSLMRFLGVKIIKNHSEFRLMSKNILEKLSNYSESNLFLRGLIPTLSNNTYIFSTERKPRIAGTPKYNFLKSLELAFDGITSCTIQPVRIIRLLGVLFVFISLFLIKYSLGVFSIWFVGGFILFAIGVVGEYSAKSLFEARKRPRYFIEKEI